VKWLDGFNHKFKVESADKIKTS